MRKDKEELKHETDKVWKQVEHYQRLLPAPKEDAATKPERVTGSIVEEEIESQKQAAPTAAEARKKKESKAKKRGLWDRFLGREK